MKWHKVAGEFQFDVYASTLTNTKNAWYDTTDMGGELDYLVAGFVSSVWGFGELVIMEIAIILFICHRFGVFSWTVQVCHSELSK